MSYGIISAGSQASFLNYTKPNILTTNSTFEPCPHFTTHIPKPIFAHKTHSKSTRTSPIMAAVTDTPVYVNTEISFYDLLGISENGTLSEIKKAYKQLARKYHPDVSPADHAEEYTKKFIQVQEAYETLSDPKSRALYDRDMAAGFHMAFLGGKRFHPKKARVERDNWRELWQSQLAELEGENSINHWNLTENMSWGARMRMQRSKQ